MPSSKLQARPQEPSSPLSGRHEVQPGVSSDPNALQAESLQTLTQPGPIVEHTEPIWVQRLKLIVFVMLCIELGLVLVVLPWHPVWMENSLLQHFPTLRALFRMNFLRGAITGLGLVDVWIGIWEAVHYRETKAST
jgi:hypothetical protein